MPPRHPRFGCRGEASHQSARRPAACVWRSVVNIVGSAPPVNLSGEMSDDKDASLPEETPEALLEAALDAVSRARQASGRAAQLVNAQAALRDDVTYITHAVRRIRTTAAGDGDGPAPELTEEAAAGLERALYEATSVLHGSGPGGDLRAHLPPANRGYFLRLMVGKEANVQSVMPEERLRLKEEYYEYRDQTSLIYVAFPAALLVGRWLLPAETVEEYLPFALQVYWAWLLYFYAALALRENILRSNGSSIQPWWIHHHYFSIALSLVTLTVNTNCELMRAFVPRYLVFVLLQGFMLMFQNTYQRKRMYTRIALGRNSAMDVVSGEASGGVSATLKVLYPMLFVLQSFQLFNGITLLVAAGRWVQEHGSVEWQVPAAALLFILMAVGNSTATFHNFQKRQAIKREAKEH